jgi:hypothetical protein
MLAMGAVEADELFRLIPEKPVRQRVGEDRRLVINDQVGGASRCRGESGLAWLSIAWLSTVWLSIA